MGRRNYGPIPIGVWDLPEMDDLTHQGRAAFLSVLGICCYHGRYPRDPRALYKRIGWPKDDLLSLAVALNELDSRGLTEWWVGSADGRPVWVGHVIGYHGLEGLPRDRAEEKRRPKPELPDADEELGESWERPGPPPAVSHPSPCASPSVSHESPHALPTPPRSSPAATPPTPPSRVEDSRVEKGGVNTPPTRARADAQAAARPLSQDDLPALCEKGQALMDEFNRRYRRVPWEPGKKGGFFQGDGPLDLETRLRRLKASHPDIYVKACDEFWPWWDKQGKGKGKPGEPPWKPAAELERWLTEEGGMPSVVLQVLEGAGMGGEG